MATGDEEISEFIVSLDDIDTSLLPPHARTPGTDDFREEVSKLFQKDFTEFGGWAKIVVDSESVRVSWRGDPNGPNPMQVVLDKLKRGEYSDAVRMLELFRSQQPDNVDVLCNLGMALSDMGQLDRAVASLRHAVAVAPDHVGSLIALGVALARQQKDDEAIIILRNAVDLEPENPWANRNLGACLIRTGHADEAEQFLRRSVELNPKDQQSVFGLAQALQASGKLKEADELYGKAIELDYTTHVAELAGTERRKMAESSFRSVVPGVRPDGVMYCLGAIRKFETIERAEVQRVTFEIAVMGQRGLDTNDPAQKYRLKNLPGQFSGLHLLCIMYVGFQMISPEHDIGFDLSKEYEAAKAMHKKRGEVG